MKGIANSEHIESLRNLVCDKQVIFVVGLYKTGTSLATELCARFGAVDVSRSSNSLESGFGITRSRYLTRECKVLRKINEQALPTRRVREFAPASSSALKHGSEKIVRSYQEYLRVCPDRVVLKDVRFIYCLNNWIEAARRSGRSVAILFTSRDRSSLIQAWDHAPFTRGLLASRGIESHADWFRVQQMYARELDVACAELSLDDVKLLNRTMHATPVKA